MFKQFTLITNTQFQKSLLRAFFKLMNMLMCHYSLKKLYGVIYKVQSNDLNECIHFFGRLKDTFYNVVMFLQFTNRK